MDTFIIVLYSVVLFITFIYSFTHLELLFSYRKARKNLKLPDEKFDFTSDKEIPLVTVQLPLYNELYVLERLFICIAKLDYPKDKLEIQVLDDSTDESTTVTKQYVLDLQSKGFDIKYIHRVNREGFKAGALKEGLAVCKGEFIAVFDSDFMPQSSWLLETVPYFKNKDLGLIQTRWGHLNRNHSILTKIQAFALDFHFTMEQQGRNYKDYFINFNGTAGIWRKSCIIDAGNWQGDTLTEDLDLSYRAQLRNWKFLYLKDVETPAELPIMISAAKSQQFRWNKGAAENFQKIFKTVRKDQNISFATKCHSFFHLLNSSFFGLVLLIAILSVPVLYIKNTNPNFNWYFNVIVIAFSSISTIVLLICYWHTYHEIQGKTKKNLFVAILDYIALFFNFFSIALGLSFHNTCAIFEGHRGKKSEFVRTPKFNEIEDQSIQNAVATNAIKINHNKNKYLTRKKVNFKEVIEFSLLLYFAFGIYSAFTLGDFRLVLFHIMLCYGLSYILFKSVSTRFAKNV